jgi:acyl dehydratase
VKSSAGLTFEECLVGEVHRHASTRTVTSTDNLLFSALTINTQPLHLDAEFARSSIAGEILANSIYTIGLVCGISMSSMMARTMFADLGFEEIHTPNMVRLGDTLRAETLVAAKRECNSRKDVGIVYLDHTGLNQNNEKVVTARQVAMIYKRAHLPAVPCA